MRKTKTLIYNEDCLLTVKRPDLDYDYVLMSPADPSEMGMCDEKFKVHPHHFEQWRNWQLSLGADLNPRNNVLTIILSDRKVFGRLVQKHRIITEVYESLGWELRYQKIWDRMRGGSNMYRLGYTFVLTFVKPNFTEKLDKLLYHDVFQFKTPSATKVGDGKGSFPIELVRALIRTHTKGGQTVFDPFMGGCGGTALASILEGRNAIGTEIVEEKYRLCLKAIERIQDQVTDEEVINGFFQDQLEDLEPETEEG